MPDPTQPMPPAQPPRSQPPQAAAAGQGAPPPGAAGPGAPAGPPPAQSGWPPQGEPHQPYGPPPRRPGLWRQATSTTGGKLATGIAIVLAGVLLLGVLAVGAFGATRAVGLWGDHGQRASQRDGWGPGGRFDDGNRMGPGMGPRSGPGNGNGNGQGNGLGGGMTRGNGMLGQLGGVQHGELTVTGSDGKAVVMTVQRGTVTAASATSVSVRSDDGYAQTYAVNASTRVRGISATQPQRDDQVVVLARKADKVATQIRVVNR
ncbi:hypothetical protein [Pedococcus cremeus]|uniref:hypothetical protein n=1 Tax=Pedococcus cremeus TaxID=587636 RepID=UPI00115FBF63|nr:hypothetical protein [Pedococcus cremeus]